MPDLVGTAEGEPCNLLRSKGAELAAEGVDRDSRLVAGKGDTLELGAAEGHEGTGRLHPVILHQRPADKTRGDIVLVSWMDVYPVTQVDDDCLAGVR